MLRSFGWTERPFPKSNLRFCSAKRSQHALRSPYGPIPLIVLLPANSICYWKTKFLQSQIVSEGEQGLSMSYNAHLEISLTFDVLQSYLKLAKIADKCPTTDLWDA